MEEEKKNKEEINLQEEQLHKQDIRGLFISSLIMIALIILISYFFREKIIFFCYIMIFLLKITGY